MTTTPGKSTAPSPRPPPAPERSFSLSAESADSSGFTFDSDSSYDLGGALLAAGSEARVRPRYEGRSDPVTISCWGGPRVTPSTVLGVAITGGFGTAKMRQAVDLNKFGGIFKQEHDLPRRVGANGKLEMDFDFAQKGWYFTKGDTDVRKAMKHLKELVDAEAFVGCKFTWKTVRLSEERALQLLRALRFREGLNDFVDLTQEGSCLVTSAVAASSGAAADAASSEQAKKRKR